MLPAPACTVTVPPRTSHCAGEPSFAETHSRRSLPLNSKIASDGMVAAAYGPGATTGVTGDQTSVSSGRGAETGDSACRPAELMISSAMLAMTIMQDAYLRTPRTSSTLGTRREAEFDLVARRVPDIEGWGVTERADPVALLDDLDIVFSQMPPNRVWIGRAEPQCDMVDIAAAGDVGTRPGAGLRPDVDQVDQRRARAHLPHGKLGKVIVDRAA